MSPPSPDERSVEQSSAVPSSVLLSSPDSGQTGEEWLSEPPVLTREQLQEQLDAGEETPSQDCSHDRNRLEISLDDQPLPVVRHHYFDLDSRYPSSVVTDTPQAIPGKIDFEIIPNLKVAPVTYGAQIVLDPSASTGQSGVYQAGETLTGSYQLFNLPSIILRYVEMSLLWRTTGKGNTDTQQWAKAFLIHSDSHWVKPQKSGRFRVVLPLSPRSYSGVLLQIRWLVRIRIMLWDGSSRDFCEEISIT